MMKKEIKAMMEKTGQKLVYEDENTLEYENTCFGEPITFEFNEEGIVCQVYS